MKQSTAQNVTTVVFLALMLFNLAVVYPLSDSISILKPYITIYGVHLSIILTFYFTQDSIEEKSVAKFRFFLLLAMLLLWNTAILITTYSGRNDLLQLEKDLTQLPEYAGFLIAAGIIWLFNGKSKKGAASN